MMGDAMPLFLSMLVAAVAALAATPVANRVAVRIGAVAIPNEAR
jgi:hypothetical protein